MQLQKNLEFSCNYIMKRNSKDLLFGEEIQKTVTLKRINFGLKECDITGNVCVNKQHLQMCALKLNMVLAITTCI